MAADVDVQYFSHLNGLVLGNNWGDLIRVLDKALVTGIDFTQITAASIDAQGDVHITLFAAHNAMLFQVVELSGFTPNSLNQKYRIKGLPNTTQLILKPKDAITGTLISVVGNGKLAPLGYDIIFRDVNDVKRVYRAKNPIAQHPYIRVDESLASLDGSSGVYNSTYAKFAMVGLLEHMDHIDDFDNPNVLQLPFDPSNPTKNWEITGTGASVVRGWSRWVWARGHHIHNSWADASSITSGNRTFTLVGCSDAFYLQMPVGINGAYKRVYGAGLYDSAVNSPLIPPWFLLSRLSTSAASVNYYSSETYGSPFTSTEASARFITSRLNDVSPLSSHVEAKPVLPNYESGYNGLYNGGVFAALQIPFSDSSNVLRGTLKHICYNGKNHGLIDSTQAHLIDSSIYVQDGLYVGGSGNVGSMVYYLGELE
ncbi:hypothetical protein [Acinetobacter johnsonii]|uniref:hypothetical protein n=1 Tax=Acinetobacter johnsonii TaxID=40214 RepID=UPI00244B4FB0|nr:hypothetical protein [Acinetobacter johnsonii]MDH1706233.1 hypothetical protein [Acinetobacter johnsonii]